MDTALDRFFSAWGETDPSTREDLVRSAFANDGRYADPKLADALIGAEAIAEYVGGFVANAPGATARVVDSQHQHGLTRATVAFEMTDGARQHGQYFVSGDDNGRIVQMVGFVGTGAES